MLVANLFSGPFSGLFLGPFSVLLNCPPAPQNASPSVPTGDIDGPELEDVLVPVVVQDEARHEVVEVAAAQVDAAHVPHQDLLQRVNKTRFVPGGCHKPKKQSTPSASRPLHALATQVA